MPAVLEDPLADVHPDPTADAAIAVRLEKVVKRFGDVVAVDGVDLAVREGEFFSMLGPSGSGKTTCLRMIAGFEQPSEGRILLGGEDISRMPPYEPPPSRDFDPAQPRQALRASTRIAALGPKFPEAIPRPQAGWQRRRRLPAAARGTASNLC